LSNSVRKVPFKLKAHLKLNKNISIFPNQKDARHFRYQWNRIVQNVGIKRIQLKSATFKVACRLERYASIIKVFLMIDYLSILVDVPTSPMDSKKAL
jgi:hypothetical protein